jgi:tetratricopeptide (TPR) repeat protein
VVARTSSFSFKGKNADVSEIAQKLNVQNVLEGSLRREGNRIRITAQLINARNGFHIWSETFERELQGVFAVQDEITRSIVDALKIKLAMAPATRRERDTAAYDLYLQGLYLSNKSDEENLRKSLSLFQQALERDPNFSRAWTGIAKAWDWLADAYVKPLEAYPAMRAAASKAIELDEAEAEAHCYLGDSKRVLDWDVAGGEAEFKRALQLDPNSGTAHFFLALSLSSLGEAESAQTQMKEAVKLDPLSPIIGSFASMIDLAYGRLDDAIAEGRRTQLLDPNYFYQGSELGAAYREKGMFAEALELYKKAGEVTGVPQPGLAITYAKMGRLNEAEHVFNEVKTFAATHYVAGEAIASICVALKDNDSAFQWLERAYQEHSGSLHGIAVRPEFRPLYSDPRFADLLRRMGVDPAKALARQKIQ